jgi:hypothetical protein
VWGSARWWRAPRKGKHASAATGEGLAGGWRAGGEKRDTQKATTWVWVWAARPRQAVHRPTYRYGGSLTPPCACRRRMQGRGGERGGEVVPNGGGAEACRAAADTESSLGRHLRARCTRCSREFDETAGKSPVPMTVSRTLFDADPTDEAVPDLALLSTSRTMQPHGLALAFREFAGVRVMVQRTPALGKGARSGPQPQDVSAEEWRSGGETLGRRRRAWSEAVAPSFQYRCPRCAGEGGAHSASRRRCSGSSGA